MSFYFIVTLLFASSLIAAGGIGILVAVAPVDWRLRVGCAVLLLSPLLALPAVELFWMFGLQVLLVALQIRLAARWHLVPLGDRQDAEGQRGRRLSIASGLFVTALAAGMIMVLKVTPALNGLAWYSHALIAVTASCCTTLAWLVVHLRWRRWLKWPLGLGLLLLITVPLAWTDFLLPSLMSQFSGWPPVDMTFGVSLLPEGPTWLWFAITSELVIYLCALIYVGQNLQTASVNRRLRVAMLCSPPLALVAWTFFQLLPPLTQATKIGADHFAFERVIEISKRIDASSFEADSVAYGGWEAVPAQQLTTSLAAIRGDVDALIKELQHPLATTPARSMDDVGLLASIRSSARALLAIGKTHVIAGRPDEGMEAYLSAIRLGLKSRRGGLLIDELIGRAVIGSCTSYLYEVRHHISSEMRTAVSTELAQLTNLLEPLDTVLARDRAWTKSQGWFSALQIVLTDLTATDNTGPSEIFRTIRNEELTELRLLILEFALSAYAIEREGYPENLDALVPDYLTAVPLDPFAQPGQTFQYRVSDATYQLYSVGQNGVDDGGTPYPIDAPTGMIDKETGDMLLSGR